MLKMKKRKNLQPRLLYLARIIFTFNRDSKRYKSKEKLREFRTAKKLYNEFSTKFSRQETQRKKRHTEINLKQ